MLVRTGQFCTLFPEGGVVWKIVVWGLPLITYASRGVGGSPLMHTNAYKGGRGGLNTFCTQVY